MAEKGKHEILDVLGVELKEIDRKKARELDISNGIKIVKINAGILQRQTDLRPGFIITKVDSQPVSTVDKFVEYLESIEGGVMLEGVYEDYPGKYYYAFGLK